MRNTFSVVVCMLIAVLPGGFTFAKSASHVKKVPTKEASKEVAIEVTKEMIKEPQKEQLKEPQKEVKKEASANTHKKPAKPAPIPVDIVQHADIRSQLVCKNFIVNSKEGPRYGALGRAVIESFKVDNTTNASKLPHLWQGAEDFKNVCPQYFEFDTKNRINFWILVLNYMAYYESTCRDQVEAQGPDGVAQGLLQLPKGMENLYARGCKIGDSASGPRSIHCALSILERQIANEKTLFGREVNSTYWAVLRLDKNEHADKIHKQIKMVCEYMSKVSGQ